MEGFAGFACCFAFFDTTPKGMLEHLITASQSRVSQAPYLTFAGMAQFFFVCLFLWCLVGA